MLTINFAYLHCRNGDLVLDLGCGEGRHSIAASCHYPQIQVVALDVNFADLSLARKRHREFDSHAAAQCFYIQADGGLLPFADDTFDHIICSEVLEHIPDYHLFFAQMRRVLKVGGTLNLSVPRYWPEKICWLLSDEYHRVEGGHIRIFDSNLLRREIQDYQFIFKRRHWAHALHVPYWWLRCAFWQQGENFFLARWYHKILLWDLLKRPLITRILDRLLNPLMGKSVVMYFAKSKVS